MGLTKTAALLLQARNTLARLQSDIEKTGQKLAQLDSDNKAAMEVLELVAEGLVDPADALDKVAEFRKNPEKAQLIKQAAALSGYNNTYSIGSVTDLGSTREDLGSAASAEEALASRVKLIIEDN